MPSFARAARERLVVRVGRDVPRRDRQPRFHPREPRRHRVDGEARASPYSRCPARERGGRRAERARPVDRRAAADAAALQDVDRLVARSCARPIPGRAPDRPRASRMRKSRDERSGPSSSRTTARPGAGQDLGGGAAAGAGADDRRRRLRASRSRSSATRRRPSSRRAGPRCDRIGRSASCAWLVIRAAAARRSRSPATTRGLPYHAAKMSWCSASYAARSSVKPAVAPAVEERAHVGRAPLRATARDTRASRRRTGGSASSANSCASSRCAAGGRPAIAASTPASVSRERARRARPARRAARRRAAPARRRAKSASPSASSARRGMPLARRVRAAQPAGGGERGRADDAGGDERAAGEVTRAMRSTCASARGRRPTIAAR